ncbi:MAG: type II toxin-antitoxin system PemK/MazF family toxin [bacterium]|nr:type II toxin-antitoxin system PemK/MazF family toxin [bacterium]
MSKGRIVLIPFPFTDLSGQKVRPALILHVSRGDDCIVAFISSRAEQKSPFDVRISATHANGLKINSVIKVDKLATLQKKIVIGELGVAEHPVRRAVDAALRKLLRV